jgi:outer membrane lipoprotein-sorting protein
MEGMRFFTRVPLLRWLVPLVSAVVLLGGGWALTQISAAARTDLRPRSAAQLLADVQQAHLDGLSGTIVQKSDLGLPSLPDSGGSGSSNLSSLVTGTHTLRVWFSGPDKARLALLGTLGESDVVWNGTDLWTWSSKSDTATHRTVQPRHQSGQALPDAVATPQAAAQAALDAIKPTTQVFATGTATVAGRPAYQLVLQPRDKGSLIGSVRIGIDGATHVPTSFQVMSRTGATAFQVAFTHFDPTRPGAAQFRFNPPPGTKVKQQNGPSAGPDTQLPQGMPQGMPDGMQGMAGSAAPQAIGHGWTSVLVADLGSKALSGLEQNAGPASGQLARVLGALPTVSGPWGTGHVFQGTIFSAVLTNDGRVAVGAVPVGRVEAALSRTGSTR